MDMREQKFGIEIELTGLTRQKAAEVIAKYLGSSCQYDGGYYEEYSVYDNQRGMIIHLRKVMELLLGWIRLRSQE